MLVDVHCDMFHLQKPIKQIDSNDEILNRLREEILVKLRNDYAAESTPGSERRKSLRWQISQHESLQKKKTPV